ncbi:hypothetical protein SASPL_108742 [Salvia splendens]|uniref:Retrotransposon gag domain-containing protein n=1 Tax=Salvia splendens TaxID=180675 RepID=A0A8X8YIP0_SALSN|nr:hypothetical protein SASPL_108742 [Salvia splendens]
MLLMLLLAAHASLLAGRDVVSLLLNLGHIFPYFNFCFDSFVVLRVRPYSNVFALVRLPLDPRVSASASVSPLCIDKGGRLRKRCVPRNGCQDRRKDSSEYIIRKVLLIWVGVDGIGWLGRDHWHPERAIEEALQNTCYLSAYSEVSRRDSSRYHRGGHWNHPLIYRGANAHWRVQEAGVVTTRFMAALEAAAAAEQNTLPPPPERTEAEKALVADDSGISSLHAHDEKEPTHAIAATPGMRTIAIRSGVLAILSYFYGLSKECLYAFLEEFCRYCDIQPVQARSTSEDCRLKAIPFVLKGDAGVWLSRLPEGSIRTWVEFRMIFLDRFFLASKTSALKREITEARQEYDEPLGQYWDRFQWLLQACPNHKLGEREIYSIFYGGHTVNSKNDLNLAAQRDFSKTPFSQAKNILQRLIKAKRSYETSRGQYRRG